MLTCCRDTDWLGVWLTRLAEDEIASHHPLIRPTLNTARDQITNLHKQWNNQTLIIQIEPLDMNHLTCIQTKIHYCTHTHKKKHMLDLKLNVEQGNCLDDSHLQTRPSDRRCSTFLRSYYSFSWSLNVIQSDCVGSVNLCFYGRALKMKWGVSQPEDRSCSVVRWLKQSLLCFESASKKNKKQKSNK